LNRDGRDNRRGQERSWNATPLQDGVGGSRGPKGTWEATPRNPSGEGDGWGQVRNRRWDAPTPRASRDGSPDEIEAGFDMREWEEEQTKLDRDWYMTGEEGGVVSLTWLDC
jgi:pre-mRNA-splicing factor ATP-dependent RNA helicase DHX38/PRP16